MLDSQFNPYCVKCKSKQAPTETDIKIQQTGNRYSLRGVCSTCGTKQCMFLNLANGEKLGAKYGVEKVAEKPKKQAEKKEKKTEKKPPAKKSAKKCKDVDEDEECEECECEEEAPKKKRAPKKV